MSDELGTLDIQFVSTVVVRGRRLTTATFRFYYLSKLKIKLIYSRSRVKMRGKSSPGPVLFSSSFRSVFI